MARMDLGDIDVEVVSAGRCVVTLDLSRLVAKVDRMTAALQEAEAAWWDLPAKVREAAGGQVVVFKVRRDET